jgi:hypothetical protein
LVILIVCPQQESISTVVVEVQNSATSTQANVPLGQVIVVLEGHVIVVLEQQACKLLVQHELQ